MTYRFLLGVPFTDKDKAKDLGAKYRKIDVLSEWFIDLPKDTNNHEIFEHFKPYDILIVVNNTETHFTDNKLKNELIRNCFKQYHEDVSKQVNKKARKTLNPDKCMF